MLACASPRKQLSQPRQHYKQNCESSGTGDTSTTIARNDATVFVGTGTSAHRFYVASAGAEHDVLALAEAAVVEWTKFLSGHGLV